jgi:hypothetical protein
MRKTKPTTLSEEEIDELVIARADEDSAWEAPVHVKKTGSAVIFHLEPGEFEAVSQAAKARGVEKRALIRQWILEKLEESK